MDIADSLNNPFHDPKHSEKLEDIYKKQVDLEDFIKRQQDDRKDKRKQRAWNTLLVQF